PEGARALHLSVRQFQRLKVRWRRDGLRGLVHRARGQPSRRRYPSAVRAEIERLMTTIYEGFNDVHLTEKLQQGHALAVSRAAGRGGAGWAGPGAGPRGGGAGPPSIGADASALPPWGNSSSSMPVPSPGLKTGGPRRLCTGPSTMPPPPHSRSGSAPPRISTATPPCWPRPVASTACR